MDKGETRDSQIWSFPALGWDRVGIVFWLLLQQCHVWGWEWGRSREQADVAAALSSP